MLPPLFYEALDNSTTKRTNKTLPLPSNPTLQIKTNVSRTIVPHQYFGGVYNITNSQNEKHSHEQSPEKEQCWTLSETLLLKVPLSSPVTVSISCHLEQKGLSTIKCSFRAQGQMFQQSCRLFGSGCHMSQNLPF